MHFSAIVITRAKPDEDALDEILWPYCAYNEEAQEPRFDSYRVGGCFQSLLAPDWETDPSRVWSFSQKRKKDIALDELEDRAAAAKAAAWDAVNAALRGRGLPDIAKLRREHGDHEWARHFHADPAVLAAVAAVPQVFVPEEIMALTAPRAEVLATARRRAILTTALVVEGQWHAFEGFLYEDDPDETAAWEAFSARMISRAHADDWLTVIDCHR